MTAAFFTPDGDAFVPGPLARGPWGQTISGNYVGGLLGHVLERDAAAPELQPARLTVDLFRPAALAPVRAETAVVRQGRRLKLVDAVMTQGDTVVARATALFLRRGAQPDDDIWTSPVTMPPLPPTPEPIPSQLSTLVWTYGKADRVPGPGEGLSNWEHSGPKHIWVRDFRQLVAGAELTPFTRAAMAGDMVSSLTHFGPTGLQWINADYTLTLARLPKGPYIGLTALSHYSDAGVATGTATVVDEYGPIGSGVANALSNPGFAPPRM
ncbi:thioesterase family protein [Mycolicibacterium sp. GF69]|uniref:acyl-CoA thioesterase domain-containing protein n=1 Tax=Mycolicibacterium sp. GF69 TaxID=2267251 RepID=UPI000DCCACD5|nr:acyl-CoA thioesterase domain-containing protein [Mycolicibacterium sp. GF69]RAV08213.1 thioesterase family protein [Mycolicibacterium sp. GF69]